ncbi:MAG TPA: TetR/AcrR family transcriptional regulator [Bacteroidales bacterium]|nr:TetR/AcrR family transcriptional regulator [Bacteroidales bacterium]
MTTIVQSKEDLLREEAISAAQKLFQRYGFNKTTMEDIARAMGRGKSTLYYYYKSKEEIFDAVIYKEIEDVFKTIRNAIEKAETAEEKLKVYFSISLKAVKKKVNLYNVVRGDIEDGATFVNKLVKKFNTYDVQTVRDILILGLKNDEFTEQLSEDTELAAYSIVSALRSLVLELAIAKNFPNWDKRLTSLTLLLLRGLKK